MESIRIAPLQPRVTSRSRLWHRVTILGVVLSGVGLTAACGDESEPPAASPESPTNEQSPLPGIMAEGACVECDFRLSPIAEVGSELDTVFPSPRGGGAVSAANQHFYACPMSERGRIGEYAPTGGLVGLRGTFGEGPGETRFCSQVAVSGDIMVTLASAHLLWSEHFGDSARTIRLPIPPQAPRMIVLRDSTVVIEHAAPPTGSLLIIEDPTGEAKVSEFDSNVASEGRVTGPVVNSIRIAPGRLNTFFIVNGLFAPRVEEWSADGLLRRWTLHAPWFWEYDSEDLVTMVIEGVASGAAVPRTMAIRIDSGGRLWTLTLVPQVNPVGPTEPREWLEDERGGPSIAASWGIDVRGALDAIIAVYQLTDSSSILLAYARVDPALHAFADDSTAYEEWRPDGDVVVYRMFRFRLPQVLENIHQGK